MLLVYFVIGAIPLGYLLGGRLRNYLHKPLKWVMLPCLALMLEASFGMIGTALRQPSSVWLKYAVCAEYAILAAFVWGNRRRRGMPLLGLSTALNFAVIAANSFRMPVTPIIYDYPELSHFVERIQSGELPEYVLVDWNAPLWFLGDTLPIFGGLASIGDFLMAIAIMIIIVSAMKNKKRRQRRNKHRSTS